MSVKSLIIILIALVLLGLRLFLDFRKDKGQHNKAKFLQALILGCLVFSNSNSVSYLAWFLRNFGKVTVRFSEEIGAVPGSLHYFLFLLNLASTLIILLLSFVMASRNLKARQLFLYVLPVGGLTSIFKFYKVFLIAKEIPTFYYQAFPIIGASVIGGLTVIILLVYQSKFMEDFFYFGTRSQEEETENILDDMDISEES